MCNLAIFFSSLVLCTLPVVGFPYSFPTNNPTDLQALFGTALSPEAEIFLPSYANFTEDLQQRWTDWAAPSYIGGIKVATAEDVQNIVSKTRFAKTLPQDLLRSIKVKIAAANKIPFLATAAGHGSGLTYAGVHNGIDIDISGLSYAHLDDAKEFLTIGGGTKFQPMWDELQPAGKEIRNYPRRISTLNRADIRVRNRLCPMCGFVRRNLGRWDRASSRSSWLDDRRARFCEASHRQRQSYNRFKHGESRPFLGDARCRLQFRHCHRGHLQSI